MSTEEMIAVMQAHLRGEVIEVRELCRDEWHKTAYPSWAWGPFIYRVAPKRLDSFDWSQASPRFKWLARNPGDVTEAYLFTKKPWFDVNEWRSSGKKVSALVFTSYQRGNVKAEDSLVERPVS